ncbi:AraC family transcriptional regulator [Brevibacillus laterosporus]|uniref:AraC family transcriptional regulator n=1 Tax=Brevibacillus laterosporus TaxID=1465 RepID=UPI00264D2BBA|nr:effector binding domain-containing protein [Brevibacillus laterosporus]MDN9010177.1 effector binding domain-containing protein [Brevibacillus laterosporus]MDO0941431.1 effector binding domain-containing protein [Brevibacillus laterosporus]
MDYFERIQDSIEFIEKNLQEELKISEISAKSCFSAFHFQRIFQAITGFSVQEYIRSRRLSEAAVLLKETRKNILEIALFFQYGSQEAFTRAFINCFGLTPAKYRRGGTMIKHQKKINFLDYKNKTRGELVMNKPEIVVLNKKHIIGYEYKTNLNHEQYFKEIPTFYTDFGKNRYYQRIPRRTSPNMSFGISTNFHDEGHFSFIIGEEVKEINTELEKGFVNLEIPGGKYAKFKVSGTTDLVQNTRRYIYGTWLLNFKYDRREGPDFEITDVLNSRYPNEMKMKIYIPI